MNARPHLTRSTAIAFAATMVIGLLALIVAASSDTRRTAFSDGVASTGQVTTLMPGGAPVCQRPIAVPSAFTGIVAWTVITPPPAPGTVVTATIQRPDTPLRQAPLTPSVSAPQEGQIPLSGHGMATSAGGPITVCLRNTSHRPIPLFGSAPSSTSGQMTGGGSAPPGALSLDFLSPHPSSLWPLLPTVLRRATVLRPSWMRAWVYWALLAALLLALTWLGISLARTAAQEAVAERAPD